MTDDSASVHQMGLGISYYEIIAKLYEISWLCWFTIHA